MASRQINLFAPATIGRIAVGDDLVAVIAAALARESMALVDGDIVIVAQKIVSKAEGRLVRIEHIKPSTRALELHQITGKDARIVELILHESRTVIHAGKDLLIVEHRLGHIMANAGIDRSNIEASPADDGIVLLLPEDPDASARRIREGLGRLGGARIGVIVSDSFGRPWRMGTVGVAIGLSGPAGMVDRRGDPDLFGRPLQSTEIGLADALASAAVLVMGEASEGCPVVVVRGFEWEDAGQTSRDLLRPSNKDVFR